MFLQEVMPWCVWLFFHKSSTERKTTSFCLQGQAGSPIYCVSREGTMFEVMTRVEICTPVLSFFQWELILLLGTSKILIFKLVPQISSKYVWKSVQNTKRGKDKELRHNNTSQIFCLIYKLCRCKEILMCQCFQNIYFPCAFWNSKWRPKPLACLNMWISSDKIHNTPSPNLQ